MSYKLEILKSEDKNNLVLSSENLIYEKRVKLNENSDLNQFPLVKQLFFLPFIKSVTIDKHLIIIEKLDFLKWDEVQDDVVKQLENYLNNGGAIYSGNLNAITVYVESTPNPNVMKFVCNKRLVNVSHEFKKISEAKRCNIAKALFNHEFVKEIFIDFNFVSITIDSKSSWDNHNLEIREFILSYIKDGNEIIDPSIDENKKADKIVAMNRLDEISQKISELIETQIKPAVASDGGNILFQSYDKDTKEVNVILQGACSGCPSSTITLKNGIETMLKSELPGKISNVVAING